MEQMAALHIASVTTKLPLVAGRDQHWYILRSRNSSLGRAAPNVEKGIKVARRRKLKLDEIGYWSEIKLDIIREYAKAYSTILAAQEKPRFHHVYIDAFAGAGVHLSKRLFQNTEIVTLVASSL